MKLVLEGVVVEVDRLGHIRDRVDGCSHIAAKLDDTEIDGISFDMSEKGNSIIIAMSGEGLSEEIVTNYPAPLLSPVTQITHKTQDARFTAQVLNKLMRKANKMFPDKALMIRDVKGFL